MPYTVRIPSSGGTDTYLSTRVRSQFLRLSFSPSFQEQLLFLTSRWQRLIAVTRHFWCPVKNWTLGNPNFHWFLVLVLIIISKCSLYITTPVDAVSVPPQCLHFVASYPTIADPYWHVWPSVDRGRRQEYLKFVGNLHFQWWYIRNNSKCNSYYCTKLKCSMLNSHLTVPTLKKTVLNRWPLHGIFIKNS